MINLDSTIVDACMSDYLRGGWQQEQMSFSSVQVEQGRIVGELNVQHFPMPDDGRFHLSAQSAINWMSQLGIIYGCWDNGLARKAGEVYLRSMALSFHRPVAKTEGIMMEVHFPEHCRRVLANNSVYYKQVLFSIEDGAFVGEGSFILPLPESSSKSHKTVNTVEYAI